MPAFTTLTLADGQTTPVNHSFTPVALESGIAVWYDRTMGVIAAQPYVTAKLVKAKGPNGLARLQYTLNVPQYSDALGKVVATVGATLEFRIPANASLQQRKDLHAYANAFVASSFLQNMVTNVEGVYA